jgi:hypothetical protein
MVKNVTVKNGDFEGQGIVRPERQALARVKNNFSTKEYSQAEPRRPLRSNKVAYSSFQSQKPERIPIEKLHTIVPFNTILSVIDS